MRHDLQRLETQRLRRGLTVLHPKHLKFLLLTAASPAKKHLGVGHQRGGYKDAESRTSWGYSGICSIYNMGI